MNQKIDNVLNLAFYVPPEEREKTVDLDVGYNQADELWEVIIRYTGDIRSIPIPSDRAIELYGGYGILRLTKDELERLSEVPTIEFIEKPKSLYYELSDSRDAACITPVQNPPLGLTGEGVIAACIDSGLDYAHPAFRNADGTTRILYLWDQETDQVYDSAKINEALQQTVRSERQKIVPTDDPTGHGTHVLGIMAGNDSTYRGVAYMSPIIFVKLGNSQGGFPNTTELMRGVDFCLRRSVELSMPMAINISFGNSYGSHNGNSLLESYLDMATGVGRNCIVIGSGNEGSKGRHASGKLVQGQERVVEFTVGPNERSLNIQLWKKYGDLFEIELTDPSGNRVILSEGRLGVYQDQLDGTTIYWIFGEPSPYNQSQEIYWEMIPSGDRNTIPSGIWKLYLRPREIIDGEYQLWMPAGNEIGPQTNFLVPVPRNTITIPSTARKVITVGAYDSRTNSPASFSGQGSRLDLLQKPDLVAPGVNIVSAAVGGGFTSKTGTSMATPFVSGSTALMMQWGIVRGRDPYLYGEKAKAYLIKGATRLPSFTEWPNPQVGWGALCLRNSFPAQ